MHCSHLGTNLQTFLLSYYVRINVNNMVDQQMIFFSYDSVLRDGALYFKTHPNYLGEYFLKSVRHYKDYQCSIAHYEVAYLVYACETCQNIVFHAIIYNHEKKGNSDN